MPTTENTVENIVENGQAAMLHSRNQDTVVFESGAAYKIYGRKNEHKVKAVGEIEPPDFEQWDEYHFQRNYQYLGYVKVVKVKRTLKLVLN